MGAKFWADLILYLHFVYVLAVVLPVPLIVLGACFDWTWIRNRRFRQIHLGMMGFVVVETILGVMCPLTWMEASLRGESQAGSEQGFLSSWITSLMFYEIDPWVFSILYFAFFGLMIALYYLVPPTKAGELPRSDGPPASSGVQHGSNLN